MRLMAVAAVLAVAAPAQAQETGQAETLLQAGQAQSARGDSAGAVATFSQVIALKPDLAIAWASRGMNRSGAGDRAGAIDDLRHALTLGLTEPLAGFVAKQLGLTLLQEKRFAEAIAVYDAYLPTHRDWQGLRDRGNAHLQLGQDDAARSDLDAAIALHPDPSTYVLRMGLAVRRRDWPAAETAIDAAMALSPGDDRLRAMADAVHRHQAIFPRPAR